MPQTMDNQKALAHHSLLEEDDPTRVSDDCDNPNGIQPPGSTNEEDVNKEAILQDQVSRTTNRGDQPANNEIECLEYQNDKKPKSSPTSACEATAATARAPSISNTEEIFDSDKPVTEAPKVMFWKTLTFWQRATEQESPKSDAPEQADKSTPPLQEEESDKINSPLSITGETITSNILNTSNATTTVTEENIALHQELKASVNETYDDTEETNFIWGMTRRVSYIPFLQAKPHNGTSDEAQKNTPTTPAEINMKNHESVGNSSQTVGSEIEESNKGILSWFVPWKWDSQKTGNESVTESTNESVSGIVEDELLRVQRKELSNQIKCLSYGIPKTVTWGFMRYNEDEFGQAVISGLLYKKPILLKKLPPSMLELNEQALGKRPDTEMATTSMNESVVLPDIGWNYRHITMKTACRIHLSRVPKLEKFFTPQKHLYYDDSVKKVTRSSSKKLFKRVTVLCFHSFFPQKVVKNIIGESTGTSEQMCEMTVKELKRWGSINNVELDMAIINLEGHGKLFDRVNGCLSILENWTEPIKNCDYLISVANSDSVPLAIHVNSKLITSEILSNVEKMGLIGLSSLCMGPIPEIESKISTRGSVGQDNEMISELFDLEDPESLQSKEIIRNMRILLRKNCKVTFVGSLNDCFSPLYSSLGLQLLHPNIYRALYIDGKDHQPDFLISLFNLILTVKNLNYKDHGLLIELSSYFSGQIGDGGHCKLLNDKHSYRVGINNMLNTSDLFYEQPLVEELTNVREYDPNDYHIPWCLRGFLEELERLQKHFDIRQIIEQLYEEFKSWEPETPRKKNLKYCMQAFEYVLNEDFGFRD